MEFSYIEQQQELEAALAQLKAAPMLSVDTEFIRTRTYFAQLALVQVYDGRNTYLFDPTTLDDLQPLWQLLSTKLLVFHAFGEDIELLNKLAPSLSERIVDTQIACAFLGQGLSFGYAGALKEYLNVDISKSQSRTDWLKRPLSAQQLTYACEDVTYLFELYQKLELLLKEQGYYEYFLQECAFQIQQRTRSVNIKLAYKSVKGSWQLSRQQLSVLQLLASWRLEQAINRNMALTWVVKSEHLFDLARLQPTTEAELSGLLLPNERRLHGRTLLKLIKQAQELEEQQWPEKIIRPIDTPAYKKELKQAQSVLKQVANKQHLPVEILASKKTINQYLLWRYKGGDLTKPPILLSDWRGLLLQEALLV